MLIRVKIPPGYESIKTEEDEELPETKPTLKPAPPLSLDPAEFSNCASCKREFSVATSSSSDPLKDFEKAGEIKLEDPNRVKKFISFNSISGELQHVNALQSILSCFELRAIKSSTCLAELKEFMDSIAFCNSCAVMISQLYKLHEEVSHLMHKESILSKILAHETSLCNSSGPSEKSGGIIHSPNQNEDRESEPADDILGLESAASFLDTSGSTLGDVEQSPMEHYSFQQPPNYEMSINSADNYDDSFEESAVYMDFQSNPEDTDLRITRVDSVANYEAPDTDGLYYPQES